MKSVLQSVLLIVLVAAFSRASAQEGETLVLPARPPLPQERPDKGNGPSPPDRPAAAASPAAMPADEKACRGRLREMGVAFSEEAPLREPSGCEAGWPVSVTTLPGDVELRPAATMTCAMAEATATFVEENAAPLSERMMGSSLAAIDQVSSYVCRPRTDGAKLSEHAFANALDWGGLELDDGTQIPVRRYDRRKQPDEARFMAALRKAACGPFKTVLGPGSDADHADHFHFDLAERRNGGTWCR